MPLAGWTRLPGRAERYRNPQGREVSRRQYENARARQSGWRSWSHYQKEKRHPEYQRLRNAYFSERNATRRDIGPNSEFAKKYRAAMADRSHKAGGALADFLEFIGIRKPHAEYDVGDTPHAETGK